MDSGSSVTAMSNALYQTVVYAGAPVGALGCTSKTLRGANGTSIGVSGCSHCVVSLCGDRYGRWVTYSMCTPPDVTSEDEERRRVCC